jgi:predicted DsbA family dithiol-disulfide isomerase
VARTEELNIVWRPFELRPEGAPPPDPAYIERIAQGFKNHVEPMARQLGVEMHQPAVRPRTTRLAHEAARFARSQGKELEMVDAIFRAYWVDGRDIGQVEVLCDVALQAGVDPVLMRGCLDDRTMAAEVAQELKSAVINMIDAVPHFIFGGKYTATGLQSEETIRRAVNLCQGQGLIRLEE